MRVTRDDRRRRRRRRGRGCGDPAGAGHLGADTTQTISGLTWQHRSDAILDTWEEDVLINWNFDKTYDLLGVKVAF